MVRPEFKSRQCESELEHFASTLTISFWDFYYSVCNIYNTYFLRLQEILCRVGNTLISAFPRAYHRTWKSENDGKYLLKELLICDSCYKHSISCACLPIAIRESKERNYRSFLGEFIVYYREIKLYIFVKDWRILTKEYLLNPQEAVLIMKQTSLFINNWINEWFCFALPVIFSPQDLYSYIIIFKKVSS